MCIRDRKRTTRNSPTAPPISAGWFASFWPFVVCCEQSTGCLLYTSDAADERSSVDLGGRRIIKKKKIIHNTEEMKNETIDNEKSRAIEESDGT